MGFINHNKLDVLKEHIEALGPSNYESKCRDIISIVNLLMAETMKITRHDLAGKEIKELVGEYRTHIDNILNKASIMLQQAPKIQANMLTDNLRTASKYMIGETEKAKRFSEDLKKKEKELEMEIKRLS